jgi:annexin A7/11
MPPAAQYGAPPPGQYNAPQGAPTPPSLGYSFQQTGHINVTSQIEALYKAMKGFGTNEGVLITTLSSLDPIQVNAVREQYSARYHKDLIKHLESETSGDFEAALVAIARGPLIGDCWALKNATKGLGTKEQILDDVLVGRSNADMNAIKTEYQKIHHTPLEADLKSDLSAATETMFLMITAAKRNEDSVPVIPQQIDQDVRELQDSFGNMVTKNAEKACQILTSRNDAQIRAIAQKYEEQYRQSFSKTIEKTFSGHMEKTLLLLVARAQNRAKSDAIQLEQAMAGPGTKDTLLIQRVVRAHWDRQHMQRVRHEYQILYRKDLIKRIDGETSGYYKKLLIACVS